VQYDWIEKASINVAGFETTEARLFERGRPNNNKKKKHQEQEQDDQKKYVQTVACH